MPFWCKGVYLFHKIKEVITVSANLEAKKQVVEEIKEKIQASKSVVFVKFSGLTVAEDTALRH